MIKIWEATPFHALWGIGAPKSSIMGGHRHWCDSRNLVGRLRDFSNTPPKIVRGASVVGVEPSLILNVLSFSGWTGILSGGISRSIFMMRVTWIITYSAAKDFPVRKLISPALSRGIIVWIMKYHTLWRAGALKIDSGRLNRSLSVSALDWEQSRVNKRGIEKPIFQ